MSIVARAAALRAAFRPTAEPAKGTCLHCKSACPPDVAEHADCAWSWAIR